MATISFPDGEPRHLWSDGLDDPCDIHAENFEAGTEHPEHQRARQREPAGDVLGAGAVVGRADRAGVNANQNLAATRLRGGPLFDPDDVGSAEAVVHGRPHRGRGLRTACGAARVLGVSLTWFDMTDSKSR